MSKVNLESYHWETVNDVDFFTNGVTCTDINVKDTVRQLCFQHMDLEIERKNEEICISPEVVNICIPNRMFPNVKNVKSNSKVFKSGKYLVVKSTLRLLNAFGQSEDTPLDGSDFISINEYALDGCKSHEFVNLFSGGKFTTYENSFTGSGFMEQPFANGLKAFRTQYETTIIDIDENADIVILPEGKIKFHQLNLQYALRFRMRKAYIMQQDWLRKKLSWNRAAAQRNLLIMLMILWKLYTAYGL